MQIRQRLPMGWLGFSPVWPRPPLATLPLNVHNSRGQQPVHAFIFLSCAAAEFAISDCEGTFNEALASSITASCLERLFGKRKGSHVFLGPNMGFFHLIILIILQLFIQIRHAVLLNIKKKKGFIFFYSKNFNFYGIVQQYT